MELRSPRAKKKYSVAKVKIWGKMFRQPTLMIILLATLNCDVSEQSLDLSNTVPNLNSSLISSDFQINKSSDTRWRKENGGPSHDSSHNRKYKAILSDIRYFRRHLNREIVNFVMTDTLMDGEFENRVHYNGITAKETYVGKDGSGLKLRQLTDGRHFVQVIYAQNGDMQDCEYITQAKRARLFLRTLRTELKDALDELAEKMTTPEHNHLSNDVDNERLLQNFDNVTFKLLRNGEMLPLKIAAWMNYDDLRAECLQRHEEIKYMLENRNKVSENSLARFRACLKLADTSVSNMVGKLFFNVVQTKCFILKRPKICIQRSWWGKCLKWGRRRQARLRNNLPY